MQQPAEAKTSRDMDFHVLVALQQSTAWWSALASGISQLVKGIMLMATNDPPIQYRWDFCQQYLLNEWRMHYWVSNGTCGSKT
jgi:hypothetical protein